MKSPDINELAAAALRALLDGTSVTLTVLDGKHPARGWPRGELMCVNAHGRSYSYDPIKVLKYLQKLVKELKYDKANQIT